MSLRQKLDKYYGTFRQWKVGYVLLNVFNRKKLRHAKAMYKKYGIKQSVLMPISSERLPHNPDDIPWLDRPDGAEALKETALLEGHDPFIQAGMLRWSENGYLIWRGLFKPEEVEEINSEVDRLIRDKVVDFNFTGRKIMSAYQHSEILRNYANDPRLEQVMCLLLNKQTRVFQSINFLTGSEQAAHSDSIHMTTYPLGYMIAAWIALEPITADNGPLIYYPGSHKLPYLLNGNFDHGGNRFVIGSDAYARYEQAVDKAIQDGKFERKEFYAQPGDVLFWHANLLHGGKKMATPHASRKSMVIHCFADDVLCYHELTQRPAMMEE